MPNPAHLDQLLQLAGLLGADAAWLLRGSTEAQLDYFMPGDPDGQDPRDLLVHQNAGPGPLPVSALLIAHWSEADIATPGLEEIKLPLHSDREIQILALLSLVMDALTRIGPKTTARALTWVFSRYGISDTVYEYQVRDRRPKQPAPAPPPAEPAAPATAETTPNRYRGVFVIRNAAGEYWTTEGDWSKRRQDAKVYKLMAWAARTARACGGEVEQEQ